MLNAEAASVGDGAYEGPGEAHEASDDSTGVAGNGESSLGSKRSPKLDALRLDGK